MRRLVIREEGDIWPTVVFGDRKLVIYYIGKRDEDTIIEEMKEINFKEILHNLERGKSIFMTIVPRKREIKRRGASRWS
ncbi:MAG: hypothetical protein QXH67_01225 [Candidatus Bathyarchaeia archaeon]